MILGVLLYFVLLPSQSVLDGSGGIDVCVCRGICV